jgi:predicted transglutaminase-like cysteine proteinase
MNNNKKKILIAMMLVGFGFNPVVQAKTHHKAVVAVKKIVAPVTMFQEFEYTLDKVEFIKVNAPVFSTADQVMFQPLKVPRNDGRYKNVMNAIDGHRKEKPPGWQDLVDAVALEGDGLVKLKMANSIINKVPYKDGTDGSYYHPAKLYRKGGVCKDMAVSKYLLLKDAGYPVSEMRIAVLTPKTGRPESPFHVVLVARVESKDYVLDLIPAYLADQERKKLKTTKEMQIKEIREAGLDLESMTEKDLLDSKGFYSLGKYVSERGLVWAGNETGTREQFTLSVENPKTKRK